LRSQFLLAPVSNGSIALMTRLARYGGLHWDAVLGADISRTYKPQPETYRSAAAALGLAPARMAMVAAHNDDLHAARAAGLRTIFIHRLSEFGPGQITDLAPDSDWNVLKQDLSSLADRLAK
jgi:2-haloacid dehalogenase